MNHILGILLFLTGVTSGLSQSVGLPFSRYYSSQEYQGGIQNYAITQHASGLLYIANNYGLLVYDGTSWRRFSLPNGTKIRHVQVDETGSVYVSGQGEFGVFSADRLGQLRFQSLKDSLPEALQNLEEVWKVYVGEERLFFCSSSHIFIFGRDHAFVRAIESEPGFDSFHFSNNTLFVNERGHGLQHLQNGSFQVINGSFGDKLVTGLLPHGQEGQLIFTRDSGVYSSSGERLETWQAIRGRTINAALRLRNGSIAIATQLDGLYLMDRNGIVLLKMNRENGLNNSSIISLFEDLSGNLWLGHNNGLSLIQLSLPFTKIDQFSGLSGTGYHALADQGTVYFGTNNGVFVSETGKDSGVRRVPNSTGQVYQLKRLQGKVLVAHNDGAFVLKEGVAERIEGPEGIWNFQSLKNHPNLLLSGGYFGLHLFEVDENTIRYRKKIAGFDESSRIIEQDEKGNIWVAHGYKGLFKLQLDEGLDLLQVDYFGSEQGLPTDLLNNVWKVNNRLVFTTEGGIFKFNDTRNSFERDPFFADYFDSGSLIHFMAEDQMGNIYFIGETETGVLERKVDGSYSKHFQEFNPLLPLLNDDLQNIAPMRGNEVLFAANEGFVRFSLNDNTFSPPIFPTLIRAAYLTGASDSLIFGGNVGAHLDTNPVVIPYRQANLRVESSNPTPNNEKDLRYQYWLEGFETDFGEWVPQREKAYTNLREGNYTFHVRSKNLFGVISPEATYSFQVLPPWYRSRMAYLMYFFLSALLSFVLYQGTEKRFQRKTQQLKTASQEAIEAKESELKVSRKEVERLKTERLKQEIKIRDKELAAATMHLLNKNGFIDQMRNNLNAITKKSKNQEVKAEIQRVIKTIEKNIAEDRDWEQFEIHFDQVHGDFMSRFKKAYENLSPQEIKLSAYLRMNLSTKEIAYLMNISVRGVEIARYRLRKKLNMERSDNLQEYILKF
ncbi:Y_Y_Y domain-containing protein [Cyclobacterium xiamenense]|uniref:Y_Y_Y domain-containing protein n=1 Tax=Cyclobacterium xiamenense TaxID=1297121 RepID=A0A1H6VX85_9BACT|nr:triple tyrosine motif-containing protein [Cyclobacterium xiamenense]SEJ04645.1 Y_Y_Y domain-containing protein [Cyclobacterium xiamenense]